MAASDVPGIVVVGGSAGGIEALLELLAGLPSSFPLAIVIAQHLGATRSYRSRLQEVLRTRSTLPVHWVDDRTTLRDGVVYVCPQDRHVRFESRSRLGFGPLTGHRRPHIDTLFASAAATWGKGSIGIVLSGYLDDGAVGARAISDAGGTVFVQDRDSCLTFDMPDAALQAGAQALVLPVPAISAALISMTMRPGVGDWFRVNPGSSYLATA